MKAILLTRKPNTACNILNGNVTIDILKDMRTANAIRKLITKYGKARIYVAVSKSKPYLYKSYEDNGGLAENGTLKEWVEYGISNVLIDDNCIHLLNDKVAFMFDCEKIEEIECVSVGDSDYGNLCADVEYRTETLSEKELLQKSCFSGDDVFEYLEEDLDKIGYAIHISNLTKFDRPKEIIEFDKALSIKNNPNLKLLVNLTKAPKKFAYVEVE